MMPLGIRAASETVKIPGKAPAWAAELMQEIVKWQRQIDQRIAAIEDAMDRIEASLEDR